MQILDRIEMDPTVLDGQCSIRGTVPVSMIVSEIAKGSTIRDVVRQHPALDEEDVLQALKYSAQQLAQWLIG